MEPLFPNPPNALALAQLCKPYDAVIAHALSHIEEDEAGAPGFYSGGAKLVTAETPLGKLTPEIVLQLEPILLKEPVVQPEKWLKAPTGTATPVFLAALRDFMYWENYDVRVRMDGMIDRVVLVGADREWVLPAIEQPDGAPELAYASFSALSRPDCGWAREPILAYLERATREPLPASRGAGSALAEIGDVAAIPRMIELLLRDRTGELNYDVGYFGLSRLTGVEWQESYDGAWWREWWEKNRQRFPPEIAALEIER